MFLHLSVFCSQGEGSASACWDTTPPSPPGADPSPAPGAETATAADGTHPTGMHSFWQEAIEIPFSVHWTRVFLSEQFFRFLDAAEHYKK